ncbi:MAG: CYTH domain-containing protein [Acholeplasmatales bacterium]|jgi:uncharacterized protein YjbK|nr:CYTH domain-containing protein [Acholeplasmatales bacterium]
MDIKTEIEFKTSITFEEYERLLHKFNLENSVFVQTNHYFDTDNYDLNNLHYVIRIRDKGNGRIKLTLKMHGKDGINNERHHPITSDEATKLMKSTFDTTKYFNIESYQVSYKASLTNYRATIQYKSGELFLDKSTYNGITDYEIEYEAPSYDKGAREWNEFLKENNIEFIKIKKKSTRALGQ